MGYSGYDRSALYDRNEPCNVAGYHLTHALCCNDILQQ